MKIKRADFVRKSTEIREAFSFAQPNQILQAVWTYCCSLYGAMTWSLFNDKAMQVFNCWSTCAKLAWGVTRATHTYFVDNLLSGESQARDPAFCHVTGSFSRVSRPATAWRGGWWPHWPQWTSGQKQGPTCLELEKVQTRD